MSLVQGDGAIVETVYRSATAETALVVARDGKIEIVSEWRSGMAVYAPVRPSNNLIKHRALLFPSEVADPGEVDELLDELAEYIRRYVSLSDQAIRLACAYVLLSWVYDAFNELPYLRFRGDYGTGKTRALMVIGSLCYKAFFASGASTVSPIFHTLDTFKGTLIFDEADFRFTDEKAELVKILNNGNVKGFPVLRTQVTQQREFDPRAFAIFGPKIVGMRRSYEDRALESRFLTIEMAPGLMHDVPINLPAAQQEEALQLRNKLLSYRLRNRLAIGIDTSLLDASLEPRMNQILLPLLSVLPNEAYRAPIRQMARDLQSGVVSERNASSEGQLLTVLNRVIRDSLDGPITLKRVADDFAAEYGSEFQRPITNRWISSMLRRLGVILYKSNGIMTLADGQDDRIGMLAKRYGVVDAAAADEPTAA